MFFLQKNTKTSFFRPLRARFFPNFPVKIVPTVLPRAARENTPKTFSAETEENKNTPDLAPGFEDKKTNRAFNATTQAKTKAGEPARGARSAPPPVGFFTRLVFDVLSSDARRNF